MAGLMGASAPTASPAGSGAQLAATGQPSFLDVLGQMLFNGGSPGDAAMEVRQREYRNNMLQAMPQVIASLPDDQKAAAIADPSGFWAAYTKNLEPQNVKGGESVFYGGPNGPHSTAPLLGVDAPSGTPYALTDKGATATGPSFGGDYDITGGIVGSKRTGMIGSRYGTPQTVAPGAKLVDFTPAVLPPAIAAAAAAGGAPPSGSAPGPSSSLGIPQASAPSAAPAPAVPQMGQANVVATGNQPRTLSPDEVAALGYAPGTVVTMGADGVPSVSQQPQYGPEAKSALRNQVLSSEEYKQAQAAQAAYSAMTANAKTMTGPAAYSMLDTFARAINPGAVARPTVIQTIEKNLGLPASVVGTLESGFGKGNLPTAVRQQIIDAVVPFAQTHWDQANALNQANAAIARSHKFDPAEATAPLGPRPGRFSVTAADIGLPQASERQVGKVYQTPRGPMKWTGTGWLPGN